jgi:hypothetical protein
VTVGSPVYNIDGLHKLHATVWDILSEVDAKSGLYSHGSYPYGAYSDWWSKLRAIPKTSDEIYMALVELLAV